MGRRAVWVEKHCSKRLLCQYLHSKGILKQRGKTTRGLWIRTMRSANSFENSSEIQLKKIILQVFLEYEGAIFYRFHFRYPILGPSENSQKRNNQ